MAGDVERKLFMMQREEEEKQTKTLATTHGFSYVYLVNYPVLIDILYFIKPEEALKYSIVSYLKVGDKLKLATFSFDNPGIKQFLTVLQKRTGLKPILSLCSKSSFNYILGLYQKYQEAEKDKEGVEFSQEEANKLTEEIKDIEDLKNRIGKVSTTHLLDVLFAGAIAVNSSDIHLEPQEKELQVRFRIDGVLQNIVTLPMNIHKQLTSRIKYMAKLKIDVKTVPQDGRFEVKAGKHPLDIRTSTLPTSYGEAVVMRLLYHNKEFMTLEQLGFAQDYLQIINDVTTKPHGIIFNTGPTGSGKTTTLYAILQRLNKPGVKIITLEDPIEYKIAGIDQSQIDPSKKYTFASGLRSILRQDPDIIMVGEIRDQETAEIAIQAAMTGHLVLTTLHTNNAPGAIPRLLNMGIKPFLLGGSINLIIAQRLVRLICQKCHGKKCIECHNTGFHGRTTIAELLVPTAEIEDLIKKGATLREFMDEAKKSGMRTMEEDGMLKVKQGLTTREEIIRVTRE